MQLLPPPVKVVAVCTMHLIKQCSVYCCHAGQPAAHCFVSSSSDCRCHSLRRVHSCVQFTWILGGVHVCVCLWLMTGTLARWFLVDHFFKDLILMHIWTDVRFLLLVHGFRFTLPVQEDSQFSLVSLHPSLFSSLCPLFVVHQFGAERLRRSWPRNRQRWYDRNKLRQRGMGKKKTLHLLRPAANCHRYLQPVFVIILSI